MNLNSFTQWYRRGSNHRIGCLVVTPRVKVFSKSRSSTTAAAAIILFVAATKGHAEERDPMLFYEADGLKLRGHLQFGLNAVAEDNLFWDLAATTAPTSDFDPDTEWLEGYIKPGLSFEYQLDAGAVLYGKLSAVASYTWGTDAFDRGDTGSTTLEEAHVAVRSDLRDAWSYDLSLGARELRLGTGMIIANGGTSGFERGALKFGPRKAWEMAAIGRLSFQDVTGTAFYIDPNELPSTDGKNKLAGLDLRYDNQLGGYFGGTFVSVLNSETPYPRAGTPPILQGARDGTNTVNLYGKTNPFDGALANWNFTGDLAYQWNDKIDLDAWAGRVQASYAFAESAWSPLLTLGFQTFSGDDPDTTDLERFDPLYYDGSPSAWATGSKSASTFINSNVKALSLTLRMQPSQRDTVTLRYAHIRANELNSPIQFGQASRVNIDGNVISGVTTGHLSDDFFFEYNRMINRNTFLTAGVSVSFPGAGIDDVIGESADPWTGGFVNVVFNF